MMKMTSFQKAGEECWGSAFKEGVFDSIQEIDRWICKKDNFQYITGKLVELDAPVPEKP